jgi:hypothetical protein
MKFLQKAPRLQVACLCLWPVFLFGQSFDHAQNLEACKAGREGCDRSQ